MSWGTSSGGEYPAKRCEIEAALSALQRHETEAQSLKAAISRHISSIVDDWTA